jgi:hypothetical protein
MQPYEIRQLSDGSIDYNAYHARPVSLLTPAMRRMFKRMTALKIALITVALVGAGMIVRSNLASTTSIELPPEQSRIN